MLENYNKINKKYIDTTTLVNHIHETILFQPMYNRPEKGLTKYFIVRSKYNGYKKNISLFNLIRF